MAYITGIGAIFFRSANPQALCAWYRDVLGLDIENWGGAEMHNSRHADDDEPPATIWKPLQAQSLSFHGSAREFMLTLTVDDLDDMITQIQAKGVTVLGRDDKSPNGRFAWILDPEGTKIELWEVKVKFWSRSSPHPERV